MEIGISAGLKFLFYIYVESIYLIITGYIFPLPPVRKLFLTLLGANIGKDSVIMNIKFFNWHRKGISGFKIGSECFIADETLFDLYDNISLEDSVTLAPRVLILTHTNVGYSNHPLQKSFPKSSAPVTIKSGSFIGAGSIILPGVTIGKQSFVAAGSVVTKDVPDGSLFGGVPAKLLRKL